MIAKWVMCFKYLTVFRNMCIELSFNQPKSNDVLWPMKTKVGTRHENKKGVNPTSLFKTSKFLISCH